MLLSRFPVIVLGIVTAVTPAARAQEASVSQAEAPDEEVEGVEEVIVQATRSGRRVQDEPSPGR